MSDVYTLLRDKGPMTVRQIAEAQQRRPTVVNRNLWTLTRYGMVRQCGWVRNPDTGRDMALWEAVR